MPDTNIYTVGWICVVETENVAARQFLDERHELPHIDPGDPNSYTVGKMGNHNVVIAALPDGEYGITSAAIVASHMVRSFRNIRFGLMVGIGGGAPSSKHDIRLGDIVVSRNEGERSAVFQYDFGKTIQGKTFQNTKFLDGPPMAVRTALSNLRADYRENPPRINEFVHRSLGQRPHLKEEYSRPDPSSDRLYKSDFVHGSKAATHDGVTHGELTLSEADVCEKVCGNDNANLVYRDPRLKDKHEPVIHYGLIASANQLMKDATIRDKLINEKDVLCFEMEAAGLMNHFNCLVIRGICDYADSHKNKIWQGYAAMVAAAYAKDLLKQIAPTKINDASTILDNLSSG
jgi:nucleoside phosphorylase